MTSKLAALTYAVNKEPSSKPFIRARALRRKPDPADNVLSNDDIKDYGYDPKKAKALLKEAGLEKGFTTICGRCRYSVPITRMRVVAK
ncbi:hypothetical protein KCP70_10145 [Salmonella enterica subsp. enterica]|nr:hypothetical protein KCP70_10145 [Salmonella enterica subsp. enterica]